MCESDLSQFKAGGVRHNLEFWLKHCHDPAIIGHVSGLKIPTNCAIVQRHFPREIKFSDSDHIVMQGEIASMVKQGIIEPVNNRAEDGEYISNIFMRPKKDGGLRIILNLRNFNEFVEKSHFKMNSLQTAIDLMSPGAFMASVDFKSAYYSISVKRSHRKYLRFFFNGQKYQFLGLPNGLSTAPRDFTQVVKTLFRILREKGHSNTFYLDDSFLTHKTYVGCLKNVVDTLEISRQAGFTVHTGKSVLIPTQRLVFLGFVLCTLTMTVRLTTEKVLKIKENIRNVLEKSTHSIQSIAELVGQLVATFPGVPLGKLYYRQIDIDKSTSLKRAHGDFSETMVLSAIAKSDLNWWFQNLEYCYTNIRRENPKFTLKTDASNFGYGGCFHNKTTKGQWSKSEESLHINQKELLAVFYCLKELCASETNATIKIMTDNTTTLCYVNNMGGKIDSCNAIARKIWLWAVERNIWLICSFIPGKYNYQADKLSRMLNETTEWSLKPAHFESVCKRYPGLNIDLFASHCNRKLPKYVSWLPDKHAAFCDAFTLDWSMFFPYAFPPFCIIGKVLRKVQSDKATIVIVVPEWRSQYWFALLMSMLTEKPLLLPRNGRAVENPINHRASTLKSAFLACKISG